MNQLIFYIKNFTQGNNIYVSITVLFLSAFFLTSILTPFYRWIAIKFKFIDIPDEERKVHKKATPLLGGLAIAVSFYVVLFMYMIFIDNYIYLEQLKSLFYSSLLIILTGLIDDRYWLPGWLRLVVHIIAVIILLTNSFTISLIKIPYFNNLLAVLWIVGIINAFNCMDALDGLLPGLCSIYAFALLGVSLYYREFFIIILCACLAGNCLAFLFFNYKPASIFLGDNGSMFLGFIFGAMILKGIGPKNITVPIIIVGIPIYDIILVHYMRFLNGNRNIKDLLGSTGRDHMPHRLIERGYTVKQTVWLMYFFTFLCVLMSLIFFKPGVLQQLIILIILALSFSVIEAKTEIKRKKIRKQDE